jgi:cell division protein FtsW (lipid II flippase)
MIRLIAYKAIGIYFVVTFLLNIFMIFGGGSNLKLSLVLGALVAGGYFCIANASRFFISRVDRQNHFLLFQEKRGRGWERGWASPLPFGA